MAPLPHESDELFVPVDAEVTGSLADVGLSAPRFFPSPLASTSDGLVCVGGRLTPEWLLDAYRHGIFPWPVWDDEPMAWWSLDPRAILELGSEKGDAALFAPAGLPPTGSHAAKRAASPFSGLHVSRRLVRTLRSHTLQVTCDRDFAGVIQGCATAGDRADNTWLMPAMIDAYTELHRLGHAHSVEVWQDGRLAGGTYGVAIGGLFAAESMFCLERDASKVALVHLVAHLRSRGYRLLDIQQWTPHTGRLGAVKIPRTEYLRRLAVAVELPISFGDKLAGDPLDPAHG